VATRPADENGLDLSTTEARAEVEKIKALFTLCPDDDGILPEWEQLVSRHDVKGKTTHDARLVAAMRRHGLTRLLTFNASHFARFTEITVLTPEGVLAGGG
jgi:predicted nucleic acid-binding protein